jgi:hypothetical protein
MPRNNEITKRVFADIAETQPGTGSYDKFLAVDEELNLPVSTRLELAKEKYRGLTQDCVYDINVLAMLEEIIIQIRCKEVIYSELRLSLSRNYIYARSLFYRRGREINDIRVIVGTTDQYGTNLNKLLKSKSFTTICWTKLTVAMNKEIENNINQLNTVYKYE